MRHWGVNNEDENGPYTWVDDLIACNPQGVMQVLTSNGYTGFLAPQDMEDLADATSDFIEKKGEEAVIELIKVHPLYEVIADVSRNDQKVQLNFRNADGTFTSVQSFLSTVDFKEVAKKVLIIIGVAYLANHLWKSIFS
jgi:hypothetical protein